MIQKYLIQRYTRNPPNLPSSPLHLQTKISSRPSTISYNAYPAQSMPLNQRLVPVRSGIYCRNISGKLAALPRYIRWQSRPPSLPPTPRRWHTRGGESPLAEEIRGNWMLTPPPAAPSPPLASLRVSARPPSTSPSYHPRTGLDTRGREGWVEGESVCSSPWPSLTDADL